MEELFENSLLPNRQGEFENCVLGFDNLEDYRQKSPYFGALVGRFGNRIAKGTFTLDGEVFTLAQNLGKHPPHGGIKGFDKVLWSVKEKITPDAVALELRYTSPHGEEGYPGKLETTVVYRLTNENVLEVDYRAVTNRKTLVNLTQHSYFNLSGNSQNKILDHELQLQANHILDVDEELIPSGKLCAVEGTPLILEQRRLWVKNLSRITSCCVTGRAMITVIVLIQIQML